MKKKYLILLTLIPMLANAQILKSTFFRQPEVNTGFSIQTWSTDQDRVTEFVVPLSFVIPINRSLTINAVTSSAFAQMNSASQHLFGMTDTRILGSFVTADNHLLITGGVTVPTGNTRLEGDQSSITSALAEYSLNFRVPSFGQGFSANIAGLYAFQAGDFILGGGAGFVYKNGFKPYKSIDAKYKPGTEISVNIGGETNVGNRRGMKLTLDVTYTLYGADEFDETEVFKSGAKLIADLRSLFKITKTDVMLYLRERTKGKNERGFGSLAEEENNSNGNQLEIGGMSYTPLNKSFGFRGALEMKYYSKNEYESNGALILGVGAGFNYKFSNNFSLDMLFKFLTGSLKNKNAGNNITGLELSGGIKYRL